MVQPFLNDSQKDSDIAECFADYFSSVHDIADENCNLSDATLFESCHKHAFYDTNVSDLSCIAPLTVEQIDNCVKQLKYGKAAGPDGLTAEHLKHAHPALVVHLKMLMSLMLSFMAMSLKPLAAVLLFHWLRTNWVITTRLRTTEA